MKTTLKILSTIGCASALAIVIALAIGPADTALAQRCETVELGTLGDGFERTGSLESGDCVVSVYSRDRWVDWYSFRLSEPTRVQIEMTNLRDIDPYLILSGHGGEIERDDDGGPGYDARIERTLVAGTYQIGATKYDADAGSYRLTIGLGATATGRCETTDLGTLSANVSRTGELASGDCRIEARTNRQREADTYMFALSEPTRVQIEMTSRDIDPFLILSGDGGEIERDDDGGPGYDARIERTLIAGTYQIRATQYYADSGSYQLSIDLGAITSQRCEATDLGTLSTNISWTGELASGDCRIEARTNRQREADIYAFTLSESTRVQIEMTSRDIDPYLILSGNGGEIERDDDDGPGLDARIERTLTAGTYQLGATKYDASSGSYRLTIDLGTTATQRCETTDLGTLSADTSRTGELASGDCRIEVWPNRQRWTDVYAFTLPERAQVRIELGNTGRIDPYLIIMSRDGEEIERDDNGLGSDYDPLTVRIFSPGEGPSNDSLIERILPAGDYYLHATQVDTDSGSYRLTIDRWSDVETAHLELAMKYAPILHFEPEEEYFPVPIEAMVARSEFKVRNNDGTSSNIGIDIRPSLDLLRGGIGLVTYLDLDRDDEGWNNPVPPTIYAYINELDGGVLLQYWFFYLYNHASFTGAGNHEGDWESFQLYFKETSISSLLSGNVPPDEVGFASHNEGFAGVIRDGGGTAACGIFDIFVAEGRHASYPWSGTGPILDWPVVRVPIVNRRPDADGGGDRGDNHRGGRTFGSTNAATDTTYKIQMLSPNAPSWLAWDGYWGGGDNAPGGPVSQDHWNLTPSLLVQSDGWLPLQFDCSSPRRRWEDLREYNENYKQYYGIE